jgi:hypothetical protein
MFWSKKPKENPREKAIKELEKTFPSIKKSDNNNQYEMLFETTSKQFHSLIIYLPDDFPQSRPGINFMF